MITFIYNPYHKMLTPPRMFLYNEKNGGRKIMGKFKNSIPPKNPVEKKAFYKKWWFWLIVVFIIIGVAGSSGNSENIENKEDNKTIEETKQNDEQIKEEPSIPAEYRSALNKAQSYSDLMHMSKAGIYDQLTSEYGEQFSAEAAQYAIDNVTADWNANALEKAKSYQEDMSMSPNAIYDQLISEYGEQFTPEEAQYAIDNLPQ